MMVLVSKQHKVTTK